MQQLDYQNARITKINAVIPYMNDPSHRIRVDIATQSVVAEYERVDYVWDERGDVEDEMWSWHSTYTQPSAEEKSLILKELDRYVENEIVLSQKVC